MPKSSLRFPRRSVETDTVRWLQSLDEEGALGRSAGDTTDAASSTGTLTPRIRRRAMSPSDFPSPFVDDGESSEFSVDTDGYYTSMHTDSGLRPLPSRGRREGSATSGKLSRLSDLRERDSNSSLCSLESVGDKTLRASGPLTTALLKKDTGKASQTVERAWDHFGTAKKIPPLPPPRTSTLTAQGSVRGESPAYPVYGSRNQAMAASSSSSSSSTSSKFDDAAAVPSDSEASEANEKFIQKMSIDTGQIPSLCVVTPSGSDDEDEKKGQDQSDEVLRAAKEAIDAVSKVGMTSVGQAPQPPYATPVRSCVSDTILISSAQCPTPRQVLCNPSDNKESPKVTANNWSHNFMGSVVYEPDVIFLKEQAPLASGPKGQLPRIIPGSDIKSFSQQNSTSPHPHPDCSSPSNGLPSPCVTSTSIPPGSGVTNGRPGARVTLDSSGQVIHSTGSLPRRRSTSMSPVTSPTQEQSPTVFPGTSTPSTGSNSKCSSQGNRQGAYVRLDPTGSIPVTRQVQQSHHVQGKMSHLPTLKPPEERSLLSVSTVQPRRYDSNTLPRWKPPEANRPVPIFPNEIKTQGAGGDLQSYHVGTFPRRWNNFNFLRRDASSPVPKPPTQAPQPEQIVSSGGYLRLDGHPTHLEPGIPSRPVAGAGLTMGPQMQPRSEPSQSKVCPSPGPYSKSPSSRTSDGSSPPSPPVAMPLMQHLSYGNRTTTRIPTTLSGPCGSPNLMAPAVRPQQETLPPYYRPLITDPQSSSWKDTGGTGTRTTVNNEQAFHPPTANRIHMASPPPPNYITTPPLPSGACPPPLVSSSNDVRMLFFHKYFISLVGPSVVTVGL